MQIRPKNWGEFQHYKDRSPTWIKLHASMLDDYDFCMMHVASRALAPMLWLLASRYENGVINENPTKVSFKLRMPVEEYLFALKPLIDNGFFIADSELLAECYQDACLEKRRGEERREEKEEIAKITVASAPVRKNKKTVSPEIEEKRRATWKAYCNAYFDRYNTEPVRNAKTNTAICRIVDELGDEAAQVAAFYVGHNESWYVKKMHAIEYLQKDAAGLRTQWATGRTVTTRKAQEVERLGSTSARVDDLLGDMSQAF